jgi:hypothetical protein
MAAFLGRDVGLYCGLFNIVIRVFSAKITLPPSPMFLL